jgi:hypothetical protein
VSCGSCPPPPGSLWFRNHLGRPEARSPATVGLAGAVESGGSVGAMTAADAAAVSVLVAALAGAAADSLRPPP